VTDHERAVNLALKAADNLLTLFNHMGNTQATRGRILSTYRQARRAMLTAQTLMGVQQVLFELRRSLETIMRDLLKDAVDYGHAQALAELAVYKLPAPVVAVDTQPALKAWLAQYDAQAAQVQGLYVATNDMTLIVGDTVRVGALSPAPVITQGANWLANTLAATWLVGVSMALRQTGTQSEYKRQAVAAIDERTTDCCLNVHGQIVGMEEDFSLTGTPRFADNLRDPPFHWNCRTATCLVHVKDVGDELTGSMRSAARSELTARAATGTRQEIHPAHATSRRN